ncbi:MAG: LacI family DNA-binding transcriptional regulator [Lachnospiraceae bacterium]
MTIKDIARLSGYGIGTVSRVLNNHPDVSDEARAAVNKVIEETGYQPNSNARLLKMQATSSILIIVKGTHNLLFADVLEQMQTLLSDYGEDLSISYLDEDANEIQHAITLCRERNPKAIVFLGGNLEFFKTDFKKISAPCFLLTNTAEQLGYSNLSSISTDDFAAGKMVIEYLIGQGHRNIGMIGGNLSSTQISFNRVEGGREAFRDHNIPFHVESNYVPCRYSLEDGYEAAKQLLTKNPSITALFAISDVIALGAMRAISDLGKRIPEDVSLVGYDGISLASYSLPRLTTIRQDTGTMAKRCVDLILTGIHYPQPAVHITVPFSLVERESVISRKE